MHNKIRILSRKKLSEIFLKRMNNSANFPALPNILKEAKNTQQNIALNLNNAKIELKNNTKIRDNEQENFRRISMEKSRLQRSLCALDALIPNLQTTVAEIERKNKDLVIKIDHVTWNQSKAEFIANSEKKMCEKKESDMQEFINMKVNPGITKTDKEEEEKQKENIKILSEKKEKLVAELHEIINQTGQINDLVLKVEQENKVLQKRNSALLLRLQRLLKETESRRNQVAVHLEKIKQENIYNKK